jgi:hypothetical protein
MLWKESNHLRISERFKVPNSGFGDGLGMQGNTSAIVTIDKARQAVRGIVIGSQTPKSFSEIEVTQASIIYPNGEIFILDTARVILICFNSNAWPQA